jgi:tetratricopeptide (TPR) repeat protein
LKLSPDQPLTLNYLGYTWIDHNRNLRRGLAMIEKAVRLKPDDGYIVDSLGWAHYRLANFKEAVKHLEKAVELRPEDPTLNDHLGDAYWRVGREREARFQWEQALTLQPEPAEAEKMREKLEKGLPPIAQERPAKRAKNASRPERRKKRSAAGSPFAQ